MKKIVTLIISIIFCFALVISSGCGCNEKKEFIRETPEGTHQFNYKFLNKSFISNGMTDYVVVYPTQRNNYTEMAITELVYFFKQATGITLRTLPDENLLHNETNKYISLGDTTLLASSGIKFDKNELERDGYQIITKDDTIFIINGLAEQGSINGVYKFLEIAFNYDYYWLDCWDIDKNVTNLKLINFNVKDIPGIPYRRAANGILEGTERNDNYDLAMATYRFKYDINLGGTGYYYLMTMHGGSVEEPTETNRSGHNSLLVVPPDIYYSSHKDWYSPGQAQICYTANGNETERDALAQVIADKAIYSYKRYTPDKYPCGTVCFAIEDSMACCSCPACRLNKEKYGTDAASVVQLMNMVAEKVDVWMADQKNEVWYREDFKVAFYAYLFAEDAPVKYNEKTNKYEAIDDSVKLHKRVAPFYCALKSFDFTKSPKDEINRKGIENLYAWSDLCNGEKKMILWMYSTDFHDYMSIYDSFNFYNDDWFKILSGVNAYHSHTQAQSNSRNMNTGWHNLKIYLDSKLMWTPTLDVGELTRKFFNAMYKDAQDVMLEAFMETRAYTETIYTDNALHILRSNYHTVQKKEYFPIRTLEIQMAKYELALEKIEKYNTPATMDTYKFLRRNILAEWMNPAYFKLAVWSAEIGETERAKLVANILEAIELTKMNRIAESDKYAPLLDSVLSYA